MEGLKEQTGETLEELREHHWEKERAEEANGGGKVCNLAGGFELEVFKEAAKDDVDIMLLYEFELQILENESTLLRVLSTWSRTSA